MSRAYLVVFAHAWTRLTGRTKVSGNTRRALLATAHFGCKTCFARACSCARRCSCTVTFSMSRACLASAGYGGTFGTIFTKVVGLAGRTRQSGIETGLTLARARGA